MRRSFFYLILITLTFVCKSYACPDHAKPHASNSTMQATGVWVRASSGTTSAAYMTLHNALSVDDELMGVRTPVCGQVEIHETLEENGVYSMRPIKSLTIKAGECQSLKPGGYHIMLIDLKGPLKKGDMIPLTLIFKHAPEVEIKAPVSHKDPAFPPNDGKDDVGCECGHDMDKHDS